MLITMRRWIVIVLLALLPLQSTWAAVASYCGHETGTQAGTQAGAQAQHLGHHDHQHLGVGVGVAASASAGADHDRDAAGADVPPGFHFDCGHCHGGCVALALRMDAVAPLLGASHPVIGIDRVVRTLAQTPPERPQWLPLA